MRNERERVREGILLGKEKDHVTSLAFLIFISHPPFLFSSTSFRLTSTLFIPPVGALSNPNPSLSDEGDEKGEKWF